MFELTESQTALLLQMNCPVITSVRNGVVWVGSRPHRVKDLFVLRTAGLVRSADIVRAHAAGRFVLTQRGITEAQRLTFAASAGPAREDNHSSPTPPAIDIRGGPQVSGIEAVGPGIDGEVVPERVGENMHPYGQMVRAFMEGQLPDVPPLTDAGVWEALLGGWSYVAADDRLARWLAGQEPRLVLCAQEHSRFAGRALRWLAEQGIRQFVDLGCGVQDLTSHLGPQVPDDIRLALVDVHPLVVALLDQRHYGDRRIAVIKADLRQPGRLLTDTALHDLIDFGEPVAFLTVAVMQCLADADDPAALIRQLRDLAVTGSYLVVSHPDLKHPGLPTPDDPALAAAYATYTADWALRGPTEIQALLDGWTPITPGITQVARWRPEPADDPPHEHDQKHDDGLGWAVVAAAARVPAPT